jgi:hypothetical protein
VVEGVAALLMEVLDSPDPVPVGDTTAQGSGAACLRATHRQATKASRRLGISNRRTRNVEFRSK